ncbi:MAG: GatB/YqeY domain-containing protein [Dehalococcoidia bacterium]|nr:MAG: GatB/YqeY domain-containing protein [Dehalococcoidia bacterium]
MGLKEQLAGDLKDAMRAGDAIRRDVLRSLLTAISNTEIARVNVKAEDASRQALAENDVLDVVQKQAKQRRESIEEYRKGGRADLVAREEAELAIISAYLPQQLSRDEVAAAVREVIAETGASGSGDKAKVMPAAIGRLKGRADGRLINEVVTELLGAK